MVNLKWKVYGIHTEKEKKIEYNYIECRMLYIVWNKKFILKPSHIYKHTGRFKLHVKYS